MGICCSLCDQSKVPRTPPPVQHPREVTFSQRSLPEITESSRILNHKASEKKAGLINEIHDGDMSQQRVRSSSIRSSGNFRGRGMRSNSSFEFRQEHVPFPPCTDKCKSKIIHDDDRWDELLLWIPPSKLMMADLKVVFTTERHGWSLQSLYAKCKGLSCSMLMLLHVAPTDCTATQIIGAFLSHAPQRIPVHAASVHKFVGNASTFVFALDPEPVKYEGGHYGNTNYMLTTPDLFLVGCGIDGSSISLSNDLQQGNSRPCATFRAPRLTNTEPFDILQIELIGLF